MKRYKQCKFWCPETRTCVCGIPCVDDIIEDPRPYYEKGERIEVEICNINSNTEYIRVPKNHKI